MGKSNVLRIADFTSPADDYDAAIESFVNYCKAKNLSPGTITYYGFRFLAFKRFLAENAPEATPRDTTPQLIRAFLSAELETVSSTTANHDFITLRTFFNYLTRDGFLAENPMKDVEQVRRKTTVIDTFTLDQVEAVLATCGKDFVGVRDLAIILTLLDCGLRVSELCGLSLDDVSWTEGTMLVCGKGGKERIVPFGQATRQALMSYVDRRGNLPTKSLFVNCYGGGLDRYRVRQIIVERCKTAGITGVRCSPHTFRHTFAVQYLRNGGDVFSLQKMLGHSSLEMSRRYCELADSDVKEKHRQFSPADRLNTKAVGGRKRLR